MNYQVNTSRAVTFMIIVASLWAGGASAGGPDQLALETGGYLRLAVHEVQLGRMDEYREAIKSLRKAMRQQGVVLPLNAYRDKFLVQMTGVCPTEAPVASYSYTSEFESLADAVRARDAAGRGMASSPDVLAAWERVEATLDQRTVSVLHHREDLSFRPSRKLAPAHPSASLSTTRLSVRPGEEARAQDVLARFAAALGSTGSQSPLTVFETVGRYQNREFVILTSGTRELDLIEMTQIRRKIGRAGDDLLADFWASVRKIEQRHSEIDTDLSYWP